MIEILQKIKEVLLPDGVIVFNSVSEESKALFTKGITPVSYTHLDVYKRQFIYSLQVQHSLFHCLLKQDTIKEGFVYDIHSVYSPQDVYKRQEYESNISSS